MKTLLATSFTVAALWTAAASAATVTLTPRPDADGGTWADGDGEYVGIEVATPSGPDVGWRTAGRFAMRTADPALGDVYAFCVEILQGLGEGGVFDIDPTLFAPAVIADLDRLFDTAYDQIVDQVTSAAFQVAVWEIVEEDGGPLDLRDGDLKIVDTILTDTASGPRNITYTNAPVETKATAFLAGLGGPVTTDYDLLFFADEDRQDLVSLDPLSGARLAPVPLPAGGLLLLAALGGLSVVRRVRG